MQSQPKKKHIVKNKSISNQVSHTLRTNVMLSKINKKLATKAPPAKKTTISINMKKYDDLQFQDDLEKAKKLSMQTNRRERRRHKNEEFVAAVTNPTSQPKRSSKR